MRSVAVAGRWVWGVSGLVTVALLAVPSFNFITMNDGQTQGSGPGSLTRTETVSEPVTRLTVQSYGAQIQVTGAPVSHVEIIESFGKSGRSAPPISATVRDGQLSVGSPACVTWENCNSFVVMVPRDVTVTVASQGGAVTISGVAAVSGDSGGSSMELSGINGPVNVTTDGGPLQITNATGPVQADTGGGSLNAAAITAATANITTDGGPAQLAGRVGRLLVQTGGGSADIALSAMPDTVTIGSDDGPASLTVPGGPYAITTESDGGPQSVAIPSTPTAARSITVTTGGGSLQIQP
jgi:hypothetical protein